LGSEVAGAVERMEASDRNVRCVADVVQPGGQFEEFAVLSKFAPDESRLLGDSYNVRPTARDGLRKQSLRMIFGVGRLEAHPEQPRRGAVADARLS
jgi:hypothetical protein